MSVEKRRSDRLMLTIPLSILGSDEKGQSFKVEGRTITINRHGARIHLGQPLIGGQLLRIINQISRREADFRVVGPVIPLTDRGGEWGVECLDLKKDMWAIHFPPPADSQTTEPRAFLECRRCHALALGRLSLVEVEVLEAAGIISRQCETCQITSPWGYAEKDVTMPQSPVERGLVENAEATAPAVAREDQLRRHRRVGLQLSVLVRDYYGSVEITRSENVSKGGLCFASDRKYHLGQALMVACPYDRSASNIEIHARVVRFQNVEGSIRKIYGVRYAAEAG
jgi:hypothetical protein